MQNLPKTPFLYYETTSDSIRDQLLTAIGDKGDHIHEKEKYNFITKEKVKEYPTFDNLVEQLDRLSCKSIVNELCYIDDDFLTDFGHSHVVSFPHVQKTTRRLHFFNEKIGQDFLEDFLHSDSSSEKKDLDFNDYYLGFCVLRPLPNAYLGRTCLKLTDDLLLKDNSNQDQKFSIPIKKPIYVNFFGIKLTLLGSIFITQDSGAGLCASAAVWMALHISQEIYKNVITASLSEITINGFSEYYYPTRIFPARGLYETEIIKALNESNLLAAHIQTDLKDFYNTPAFIYAYNKYLGIPCILCLNFYKSFEEEVSNSRHAIIVTGCQDLSSLSLPEMVETESQEEKYLSLLGNAIESFLVHDDDLGMFIKLERMKDEETKIRYASKFYVPNGHYEYKDGYINLESIIIPLNKLIRVDFKEILNLIKQIEDFFKGSRKNKYIWDVFLIDIAKYRQDLLKSSLNNKSKQTLLTKNGPRFLWQCSALLPDEKTRLKLPIFTIYFDATGFSDLISIYTILIHKTKHHSEIIDNLKNSIDQSDEKIKNIFENALVTLKS
ncbi:MAG: hypothetical protein ACTSRW_00235 [Candidatus Helarchaeota archaeon]